MIAELLKRRHLRANRHHLTKDFYLRRAALDGKSACAWGLKSDEDHRVLRIRQPLRKMVLNSAASHHAARGDDDAGRLRLVDLLRLFCSLREVEAESVALLCCESLGLEGADYCRGYIQNWFNRGTSFDADAISEKSAQKILKAADQILKAGTIGEADGSNQTRAEASE